MATVAGLGYAPGLPGTVTSAVVAVAVWGLAPGEPALVAAAALAVVVGIWAGGREEARAGVHDPGSVVIDEVAGMLIALIGHLRSPGWVLVLFLLFRVLDVWKPFPIRQTQGLPGGVGIVADDVVAGGLANLLGHLAGWLRAAWA
ncbi:MAG: phosphatidylglycerophosphatase A family protein [Candidatus Rokuibacteriota bacterium]